MLRASCLCGDVGWEVNGPLELASHCHCGVCRKHHGTSFTSWAAAPERAFRWLRGQQGRSRFESSPGFFRSFCARCGSKLPGDPAEGRIFVPLGNFEGDPGVRPQGHIFAAFKAPWYEFTDSLPRFDTFPPGIAVPSVPERPRRRAPDGQTGGSCLCGAVVFELDGAVDFLRNCHCSRCRRARSAAHATNAPLELGRFHWIRGEERVRTHKVPDARFFAQTFCGLCGSPVPRLDPSRGLAIVPAGSLDGAPGARVMEHIFVDSKAPWFEITDALPRHAEAAPAR